MSSNEKTVDAQTAAREYSASLGLEGKSADACVKGYRDAVQSLESPPYARGYAYTFAWVLMQYDAYMTETGNPPPAIEPPLNVVFAQGKLGAFSLNFTEAGADAYATGFRDGYSEARLYVTDSVSVAVFYAYGYSQSIEQNAIDPEVKSAADLLRRVANLVQVRSTK